jgi:hypothetical protein
MVVKDLNEGPGLGPRDLGGQRRLGQTPTGNALPAYAPISVANAGRFQLTRKVFVMYAPQLRALFHINDPAFAHLQAWLADLTSANPLAQSDVRTPVLFESILSAQRF